MLFIAIGSFNTATINAKNKMFVMRPLEFFQHSFYNNLFAPHIREPLFLMLIYFSAVKIQQVLILISDRK